MCRTPPGGAWIETPLQKIEYNEMAVAPRPGVRGLKLALLLSFLNRARRTPPGGAWIETLTSSET